MNDRNKIWWAGRKRFWKKYESARTKSNFKKQTTFGSASELALFGLHILALSNGNLYANECGKVNRR